MSNFIPVDKMKRLREASKNGDEVAIRILQNHLDGKEDFYKDLDVYFVDDKKAKEKRNLPKINTDTIEGKLAKFLSDNEVKEGDEDYDEYVKAFYKENSNEIKKENVVEEKVEEKEEQQYDSVFDDLIDDELEAIEAYNKAIVSVMNNDNINESVKKGIITDLEEIRKDEVDHLEKLKRLKRDFK